jgi:WD40 repeat protein
MPKRLVGIFYGEVTPGRIIQLRQGLDPIAKLDVYPNSSVSGSGNSFAVAPDGSAAVAGNSSTSNNIRYYADPANLGGVTIPTATFAGNVYCCAISATLYAFGGSSPFLYVFDRATHTLKTLNISGLGLVNAMEFSPDGSKLAVMHSNTPYVRIYSTSDWSIVNAATAAPNPPYACCFSKDSSKLVVFNYTSPFVTVYNPTTGSRDVALTTSGYGVNTGSFGARAVRSPLPGDNRILFAVTTSGFIATFDTVTNVLTRWAGLNPDIANVSQLIVDPDPDQDTVYAIHGYGSTSPTRTITMYKISTGTPYDNPPPIFRNLCWGSGSTVYSAGGIVMTDAHTLTGTVRNIDNAPAARVVRAYSRATGELLAQTTSDATTGNYTLKVYDAGPYDVQFMTADGELLNDLFFARAEPQAVSG